MDIAVTKLEILDWIMHLRDQAKVEKVLALKAELEDEAIAYNAVGEPLNINEYRAHVNKGFEDMKNGRVTSHDDFLDEVSEW